MIRQIPFEEIATHLETPLDTLASCAAEALKTVEDKFEVGKMCQITWKVYQKAVKG